MNHHRQCHRIVLNNLFWVVIVLIPIILTGCFKVPDIPGKDPNNAMYWQMKSAQEGSVSAQKILGAMYYDGDGVPKDLKKAYAWYSLAALQGDPSAECFVNIITTALSEEDLSDALSVFQSIQKNMPPSN